LQRYEKDDTMKLIIALVMILIFAVGCSNNQQTVTDCYQRIIRTERSIKVERGSVVITETPIYGKVCMKAGSESVGVHP